jgi:BioD-like phosphotransacetylase family protein
VLPPAHIVSKATARKVPLLLVTYDTYETARRIDSMEPLMTKDDKHKIELLGTLIKENVDFKEII